MWIISVRKRVGGLKLDDLPGLEALQIPGVVPDISLITLEILLLDEAIASCLENQLWEADNSAVKL